MIPSYFKIEILAIQDEFVLLGRKRLIKTSELEYVAVMFMKILVAN